MKLPRRNQPLSPPLGYARVGQRPDSEERRFPASGGTEQAEEFAFVDDDIDSVERDVGSMPGIVSLAKAREAQQALPSGG
jgi:hypothetical protein